MRAVSSLLWEQWRQTRLLIAFGVASLCVYFVWLGVLGSADFDRDAASTISWLVAFLLLPFLCTQQSLRGLRVSYPPRMYVLPMRSIALASAPFLYKLMIAALLGAILGVGDVYVLGLAHPVWLPMLILMAIMAWAEAGIALHSAFGLGGALLRGGMLVAGVALSTHWSLVTLAMLLGTSPSALQELWIFRFVLGMGVLHLGCAWVVVITAWNAGRHLSSRTRAQDQDLSGFLTLRADFAAAYLSPRMRAAIWYEWRQTLHYLPFICVAAVLTVLAIGAVAQENLVWVILVLFMYLPAIVAFCVGHYLLRSTQWYPALTLVRPVPTSELGVAKMLAAIPAVLFTAVAVGTASALALVMTYREVPGLDGSALVPALLLAPWIALFAGRVLLLMLTLLFVPCVPVLMFNPHLEQTIYAGIFTAVGVAGAALLARAFVRGILPARSTLYILFLLTAAGWIASLIIRPSILSPSMYLVLLSLLCVSIAWAPTVLHWQRHR